MVARNDPCPCGSGKKYKKCHGKEGTEELQSIVDHEIDAVRERFMNKGMERRNFREMMDRVEVWFPPLLDMLPHQTIDTLSFDTYIYMDNLEKWQAFLQRELAQQPRTQVRKILEAWMHPFWLLGKVVDVDAEGFWLQDEVTGERFSLPPTEKIALGEWVFGIAFHDPASADRLLYKTKGAIVIAPHEHAAIEVLRRKIEEFDGDSLGLYLALKKVLEESEKGEK
ncbi:YecA family protein [Planococcus sp. FY231025]|uniref:YecA family protein n=1 Tax=Planococcus sp. FY231025 TaxID=3455699 RepID=UPI003F92C7A1